jgi:hypothetical protein
MVDLTVRFERCLERRLQHRKDQQGHPKVAAEVVVGILAEEALDPIAVAAVGDSLEAVVGNLGEERPIALADTVLEVVGRHIGPIVVRDFGLPAVEGPEVALGVGLVEDTAGIGLGVVPGGDTVDTGLEAGIAAGVGIGLVGDIDPGADIDLAVDIGLEVHPIVAGVDIDLEVDSTAGSTVDLDHQLAEGLAEVAVGLP